MQGTMKIFTFVASYVGCAITRKACVNQLQIWVRCTSEPPPNAVGGSCFSHFTQQPQSIPLNLHYALDSASRQVETRHNVMSRDMPDVN